MSENYPRNPSENEGQGGFENSNQNPAPEPQREEPRFGRRREDDPGYTSNYGQTAASGQPGYGQDQADYDRPGYGEPSQPGYGEPNRFGQPGYGESREGAQSFGYGQGGQGGYGNQGQPGYTDPNRYGQPGYGQPNAYGPGGGYNPAPLKTLPGRGGSIAMIVIGAVLTFIVAPVAFFAAVAVGAYSSVDGMPQPYYMNGDTVTVSSSGSFTLMFEDTAEAPECSLVGNGETYQLEPLTVQSESMSFAESVPAGTYHLECTNDNGRRMVGMDGAFFGDLVGSAGPALIISAVIGVAGLVVMIWGIVRLVKVNRERRNIQLRMQGW
ncbi:MAG: hypothetical protein Q4D87_05170 [Actinomycetaceae bacterium]|nr:hypothetical protein [Actinomycetaceae bacterium]